VQYEKRCFEIDVLVCPHCGGERRVIALITPPQGEVIRAILEAMNLPTEPPEIRRDRSPPAGWLDLQDPRPPDG
jgi:hypothetical protein